MFSSDIQPIGNNTETLSTLSNKLVLMEMSFWYARDFEPI